MVERLDGFAFPSASTSYAQGIAGTSSAATSAPSSGQSQGSIPMNHNAQSWSNSAKCDLVDGSDRPNPDRPNHSWTMHPRQYTAEDVYHGQHFQQQQQQHHQWSQYPPSYSAFTGGMTGQASHFRAEQHYDQQPQAFHNSGIGTQSGPEYSFRSKQESTSPDASSVSVDVSPKLQRVSTSSSASSLKRKGDAEEQLAGGSGSGGGIAGMSSGGSDTATTTVKADEEDDDEEVLLTEDGVPLLGGAFLPKGGNRKRNKTSQEQLNQLEAFFQVNRHPTGKVRAALSKKLLMPERSLQIWFQNRRAKEKGGSRSARKKNSPSQPSSGRDTSSPEVSIKHGSASRNVIPKESVTSTADSVTVFPAHSLVIGKWRRIGTLICFFSRRLKNLIWYLQSESIGYKLELPWVNVRRITFDGPFAPTVPEIAEGVQGWVGHVIFEIFRAPNFFMEVFRLNENPANARAGSDPAHRQSTSWRQCADFTEEQQATTVLMHVIAGPYQELRRAVELLNDADSHFQNCVIFKDLAAQAQLHASIAEPPHPSTTLPMPPLPPAPQAGHTSTFPFLSLGSTDSHSSYAPQVPIAAPEVSSGNAGYAADINGWGDYRNRGIYGPSSELSRARTLSNGRGELSSLYNVSTTSWPTTTASAAVSHGEGAASVPMQGNYYHHGEGAGPYALLSQSCPEPSTPGLNAYLGAGSRAATQTREAPVVHQMTPQEGKAAGTVEPGNNMMHLSPSGMIFVSDRNSIWKDKEQREEEEHQQKEKQLQQISAATPEASIESSSTNEKHRAPVDYPTHMQSAQSMGDNSSEERPVTS